MKGCIRLRSAAMAAWRSRAGGFGTAGSGRARGSDRALNAPALTASLVLGGFSCLGLTLLLCAVMLTACGGGGGASGDGAPATPSATLSASADTIAQGASVTLSWISSDVSRCSAMSNDPGWSGDLPTHGQKTVTPPGPGDYTYALSCTGADGVAKSSLTVTVSGATTAKIGWVDGYYAAYKAQDLPVSAVPFSSMTHVIHFSLVPAHRAGSGSSQATEGTVGTLTDPFGLKAQSADLVSAAHAAGIKVLLGIGGDTSVDAPLGFQQATADTQHRNALVNAIVAAVQAGAYDGVDVNWESVNLQTDVSAVQDLLHALRMALDEASPQTHLLLAYPAATASNSSDYAALAQMLLPIQNDLDQINLQTYVMAGPYPGWVTWFNSPLHAGDCTFASTGQKPPAIDSTVSAFVAAGIDPSRIGIGVQLVGVDWQGGSGTDTGGVSKPCQSWDTSAQAADGQDRGAPDYGNWRFRDVADVLRDDTQANGYVAGYDSQAAAAWLGRDEAGDSNDHFVSLETAQSIAAKAQFIQAQGLGGMIVFEISQDYMPEAQGSDAQHPLMTDIRRAMTASNGL
ncbi:glycosyl hydrolase family 18 protein [Solimonas marina]|uniref:chitinase n=1 Tax=Solimonas marina TaxID=2714601 RepID=A0A970B7B7_9GAMM|nr:glycosyl hydrolase family 18 protein [Solimonas marina]NKF23723.1 hypothetical protein [Solimonas marina]